MKAARMMSWMHHTIAYKKKLCKVATKQVDSKRTSSNNREPKRWQTSQMSIKATIQALKSSAQGSSFPSIERRWLIWLRRLLACKTLLNSRRTHKRITKLLELKQNASSTRSSLRQSVESNLLTCCRCLMPALILGRISLRGSLLRLTLLIKTLWWKFLADQTQKNRSFPRLAF